LGALFQWRDRAPDNFKVVDYGSIKSNAIIIFWFDNAANGRCGYYFDHFAY
jgi:hypothetical protein